MRVRPSTTVETGGDVTPLRILAVHTLDLMVAMVLAMLLLSP